MIYAERPSRGMAVSSLVLGVVGLFIAWIPILGYFAFPMCIIGFVLGLAAVRKAKQHGAGPGDAAHRLAAQRRRRSGSPWPPRRRSSAAVDELDSNLDDFSACYGTPSDQAACDRLDGLMVGLLLTAGLALLAPADTPIVPITEAEVVTAIAGQLGDGHLQQHRTTLGSSLVGPRRRRPRQHC